MRMQFVLDKRTNKLLEELAAYQGGNRSLVVRRAIQVYSDVESQLDEIEADPGFQAMMAKSDADTSKRVGWFPMKMSCPGLVHFQNQKLKNADGPNHLDCFRQESFPGTA
jgi:hypothetical protein